MGIGNFIMFLPFLIGLRKTFVKSDITLLVKDSETFSQIISSIDSGFNLNFYFIQLNKNNTFNKFYSGFNLLKNKWDIIFCKFGSFRWELIPLMILGFISLRIGLIVKHDKTFQNSVMKYFLNKKIFVNTAIHERENYFNMIKNLNPELVFEDIKINFLISDYQSKIFLKNKYILISPGSSLNQNWKRLTSKQWMEVINIFVKKGLNIVIIGSSDDQGIINEINHLAIRYKNLKEKIIILLNQKFSEILNLIIHSKMCFCADTFLFHLTFLMRKKTCVFISATKDTRTCYFKNNFLYIRSPECKGSCVDYGSSNISKASCDPAKCMNNINIKKYESKIINFFNS